MAGAGENLNYETFTNDIEMEDGKLQILANTCKETIRFFFLFTEYPVNPDGSNPDRPPYFPAFFYSIDGIKQEKAVRLENYANNERKKEMLLYSDDIPIGDVKFELPIKIEIYGRTNRKP
jgi:hypothetical protein